MMPHLFITSSPARFHNCYLIRSPLRFSEGKVCQPIPHPQLHQAIISESALNFGKLVGATSVLFAQS